MGRLRKVFEATPRTEENKVLERSVLGATKRVATDLRLRPEDTNTDLREMSMCLLREFGGMEKFAKLVKREYKKRDNGPQFRKQVIGMILRACEWSTANAKAGDESDLDDASIDNLLFHAVEDYVARTKTPIVAEAATDVDDDSTEESEIPGFDSGSASA